MRVVQALEFNLKLRLYHEVAVLARDEQAYEYVNCHSGTGMLNKIT
jgi:aldoxime dehydratase